MTTPDLNLSFVHLTVVHLASAVHLLAGMWALGHVVLNHPHARGAALWMGIVILVPWLGPLLYLVLGVNRVPRRARSRRSLRNDERAAYRLGNRIDALIGGDAAYPQMLRRIDEATQSVVLLTYIFDDDRAGAMFRAALSRAVRRGVAVRVLIDAIGARYSRPPILHSLAAAGIEVAAFLPTSVPWRWQYANLRSHRKLMVVDGRVGFTGGMNIRELCMASLHPLDQTLDVHFEVHGPVVADMAELFELDWAFAIGDSSGDEVRGSLVSSRSMRTLLPESGGVPARFVSSGPDQRDEAIRWLKLAAVVRAKRRVRIVTPYFVPDDDVVTAIFAAVSAGVHVQIVLPAQNNLRLVAWASRASFGRLIAQGVEIFLSPPPFEHTKLMLVDDDIVIVGSANWDERSFRLNFEADLECQDAELARAMDAMVDARLRGVEPLSLAQFNAASLASRLRDGIARLATPYL